MNDPVDLVAQHAARRERALRDLIDTIPYLAFLGVQFDLQGDALTARLPFHPDLIGNPVLPAIHGGVTAAFLEISAIIELAWRGMATDIDPQADQAPLSDTLVAMKLAKVIDITTDYLRPGHARDTYARARITRSGRRYASVLVEAWQDNPDKPIALSMVHCLMPEPDRKPQDLGR